MPPRLLPLLVVLAFGSGLNAAGQSCTLAIAPAQLKGQRPLEVDSSTRCGFLQFAWQAFLGMNWPALPVDADNGRAQSRGLPDPNKIIGQGAADNTTVWEQYQPNWYVFWPNNHPAPASNSESFAAWNQDAWLPAACGPLHKRLPAGSPPPRILSSLSAFDAMPGVSQAFGAPLIDQDGYYVRYEIQMDYPAFNYINSNQFYLADRVQAVADKGGPFAFPVQTTSTPGATFLKSAWKTLSADEINSGRYHTAQAFLYSPSSQVSTITPAPPEVDQTCVGPVTVGLVGLHIVQKTKDFPEWIWATFEQIDSTPADPANTGPAPPQGWGFFKPGSKASPNAKPLCPDGKTPLGSCDFQPTSSHLGVNPNDKTGGPTQAVRLNPIPKSPNQPQLGQINQDAQQALHQINASSVWQYYQLVEVQWEAQNKNVKLPASCPTITGFFPTCGVANMTAETYTQTSSCMGCHSGAAIVSPKTKKRVPADLTFELSLAWKPTPLPASRVPALAAGAHVTPAAKTPPKGAAK